MKRWAKSLAAEIVAYYKSILFIGIVAMLLIWGVGRETVTIAVLGIVAMFVPSAFAVFFGMSKEKTLAQNLRSILSTFGNGIIYGITDYWLAWLSWFLVVGLMKFNLGFWDMLIWMWIFDILAAEGYLIADSLSGKDITQAGAYRVAMNETMSKNKLLGVAFFIYVALRAVAWDGPERIILVFKKELNGPVKRVVPLLGLTLAQAVIWVKIYSLGTETVSEAIKMFFS